MPLLTRYDIWDLNNGKVAGHPVKNPPGWDDISLSYAKALKLMGWTGTPNPGTDVKKTWTFSETPNTYYFQAAIHWTPNDNLTTKQKQWWHNCTHDGKSERFFLAWHRAYIYWYEVIIRSYVAKVGGPDDWALPYWNYGLHANDPKVPWPRSALPWVFGQKTLPDGSVNPLYFELARRGLQPTWPPPAGGTMYLQKATPFYYQAYDHKDFLDFNKTLDNWPHGVVHGDTGSGDGVTSTTGWMQAVPSASFDPIFWLHHSEIDRFWVGWLTQPGRKDPTDPTWLKASNDNKPSRWNFWHDGNINNTVTVHPGDMLDPSSLKAPLFPHSYRYANLPQIPAPRPVTHPVAAPGPQRDAVLEDAVSPLIAQSSSGVEVVHDPVTASIPLSADAAPQMDRLVAADQESPTVVLHIDDVGSEGPIGNYAVYLDYPQADHRTIASVPHFVGMLAAFGTDHHHLDFRFDITDLAAHLKAEGEWDPEHAHVTLVPAKDPDVDLPLITGKLTIGRISITAD